MNNKVLLLGCGNLGSLLVASWMKNNFEITVIEKNKNSVKSLKKKFKRHVFETTLDNIMISEYSIIILCVKPIHSIPLIKKISKSINKKQTLINFNVEFEFKRFFHQKIAETFFPLIENRMIESFKIRADEMLD